MQKKQQKLDAETAAEAAIAKAKELKEAAAKASEEEFKAIADEIKELFKKHLMYKQTKK